ncbi:MAG TPA: winged helix-turn-helix transcriptional regulator [Acidimicrobiales bacterium]|nr:winged helix-turn-helix transcriptional regulator [Acidimicrobiales bacterium]
MTTRRRLLLLLRKHPGVTVTELAAELNMTGMGVRRHLDALQAEGLVEATACDRKSVGRPASGWRLSATGLELFPRRYDRVALEVLEDVAEHAGTDAVDAVFARRTDKLVAEYEDELAGADGLQERVAAVARIRDEAGYLAEWSADGDGDLLLTENNCAVHRVAERYPVVCAQELALLRRVLGPDVEVTREAHTMAGDAVCRYRIRPRGDHE